jgi:uncharacterized protein (TIGR03437 family)
VQISNPVRALLITVLLFPAAALGQNSFNAGQWFFGRAVTTELPAGVVDLSDNLFASENYTCALVMTGAKANPQTQLMCRQHAPGSRFSTVIAEGDPRLRDSTGTATRLAIPTRATDAAGRYFTSMVRPEKTHLYFTSVTGTGGDFAQRIAWRFTNYTTLEKIAAAGDTVTIRRLNGQIQTVTLSAAGPIDASVEGREFIYLESAAANLYGIFERSSNGVFNLLFQSPIDMSDSPWGQGGFAFADGGLIFKQPGALYMLNPDTAPPGLLTLAQPGVPFIGDTKRLPNLNLAQLFRPTNDPKTFYFSWGVGNGLNNPPEILSVWKNWAWAPVFDNQLGTPQEVTVGYFASGSQTTLVGTGAAGPSTQDYDPRITVRWPISSLWISTPTGFTRLLRETELPDGVTGSRKFYQGITSYGCEAEFATKLNDGSGDNSGPFSNFYRLYRPCPSTASFNPATGEIIVRGVNLQDRSTLVAVPPPPGTQAPSVLLTVTSLTPTEVRATAPPGLNVTRIQVVLNSQIVSDTIPVNASQAPPPNIADLTDLNSEHSVPAQGKLMTLWGQFGCTTASTPDLNYPVNMGNCSASFDDGTPAPLLYTSDGQINVLIPTGLPLGTRSIRVIRADAQGIFRSNPFPFNLAAEGPITIKAGGNPIVVVIRNGQVVVAGPNDPIHPGEYFTIYLTGALLRNLPPTANIGGIDTPAAAASVVWAQGVQQVNLIAPGTAVGVSQVRYGQVPVFSILIN